MNSSTRNFPFPFPENPNPLVINALVAELWDPNLKSAIESELRKILDTSLKHLPSFIPPLHITSNDLGCIFPRATSIAIRSTYHHQLAESRFRAELDDLPVMRDRAIYSRGSSSRKWSGSSPLSVPGDAPARRLVQSMKGSSSSQSSTASSPPQPKRPHHPRQDGVVVELGIEYRGTPTIEMAMANGASTSAVSIGSVRVTGRIEVIVAPLITRAPLIAGLQIAFINQPVIEFELSGIARPWTEHFRSAVDAVVSMACVLPAQLVYKIDAGIDYFDMVRSAHPFGVLRVAVLRGAGFPHTDRNPIKQTLGQSAEPDVYIRLRLGATAYTTMRVDDRDDPVYDREVMDFILATDSPHHQLYIEAFDYDLGPDDALGSAIIDPKSLTEKPEIVVKLKGSPMDAQPSLRLAARILALSSALYDVQAAVVAQRTDSTRPRFCSHLMLNVEIDRGTQLHCPQKSRPFVRVLLHGKKVVESWPQVCIPSPAGTSDASWHFSRHILITEAVNAQSALRFEVRDAASMNQILGHAFLHLGDLQLEDNCSKIYEFALMGAVRHDSTLRIKAGLEAVMSDCPLWQMCSRKMQMEGRGPGRTSVALKVREQDLALGKEVEDSGGLDKLVRTSKKVGSRRDVCFG